MNIIAHVRAPVSEIRARRDENFRRIVDAASNFRVSRNFNYSQTILLLFTAIRVWRNIFSHARYKFAENKKNVCCKIKTNRFSQPSTVSSFEHTAEGQED